MDIDTDLDRLRKGLHSIENAAGELQSLVSLTASVAAGGACRRFFNDYLSQQNASNGVVAGVGRTLSILEENGYSVTLGIEAAGRSRPLELFSVPQDVVVALLSNCNVHFEVFRSVDETNSTFQHGSKVAHHRTMVLHRGVALFLDGTRDHVLTWSDTPYVSLVVTRQEMARHLVVRHDSTTGSALYATAATQQLSRLQHVCDYIAHYGDGTLAPMLLELSRHPAHFIRWKAAEALLNVDFDAGLHLIGQLRADPHQHIADAAQLAWVQLQGAGAACH